MKRVFLLFPAAIIVLLSSFIALKEHEGTTEEKNEIKSFSMEKPASKYVSTLESVYHTELSKAWKVNIVYKSSDGGKTWQDISAGLPLEQPGSNVLEYNFFSNAGGLFLSAGDGIYHNSSKSTNAPWTKEASLYKAGKIAPGRNGIFAYKYEGQILEKRNGSRVWSPVYTNFKGSIREVFESPDGAVFIGSDNGLYKSADRGKSWKQVHFGGWVMNLVESNGTLLAAGTKGILRSADGGEKWNYVLNEGGVGIAIEPIKGGFAAITANTNLKARTVRVSYDAGKTWVPIDAGLPADLLTASIIQVAEDFYCGHPKGIFKSSDKGKTWKLLLPSIKNKVFNLFSSGNVIYAVPGPLGC